jgi:hypothetical protein
MNLSIEYLVRHEAAKLLRQGVPGRFLCLTCLEKALRTALGAAHTRGRVDRALRTVSRIPGAEFTSKHAFICDRCGKTGVCLSAK